MILMKEFDRLEVLDIIMHHVLETVPREQDGELTVTYNEDDDIVEVYFIPEQASTSVAS
jgi:hypothetical protein